MEFRSPVIHAAQSILLVVSALFPIVDAIGGAPFFLALTRDYTAQPRRLLARWIAVNSFILIIASFTIGSYVLSFFGNFASSGTSGRRADRDCDGMGDAEAEGREWSRRSRTDAEQPRCSKGCVLPSDASVDRRTRLNLGCDYLGRK